MMAPGNSHYISRRILDTEMPIMQVMKSLDRPEDTIDLSQGIPFFDPPQEAVRMAISDRVSINRYGQDAGDRELRDLLFEKLSRSNNISDLTENNVMVTAGANIGFLNAISAICDVGDNVILLDPFYFNHGMTLDILGVDHVHVPMFDDRGEFKERLMGKINDRTRAIVLVSPNNPTGEIISKNKVKKIIEVCSERSIWLISDETYEKFCYGVDHISPASFADDVPVISLFSLSKSHGMSGWRQGYMSFPEILHDQLLKVQDTTVICPSRIGQKLAFYCLRDHPDHTKKFLPELDRIRLKVIRWMDSNKDLITSPIPTGAFYAFPGFTGENINKYSSMDLSVRILKEAGVLLVPGKPFGADDPPCLRIAYGNVDLRKMEIAMERIDRWLWD